MIFYHEIFQSKNLDILMEHKNVTNEFIYNFNILESEDKIIEHYILKKKTPLLIPKILKISSEKITQHSFRFVQATYILTYLE